MAAVKSKSPRLHLSVVINASNSFSIEDLMPFRPVSGCVRDVAFFIFFSRTDSIKPSCNFHFFILVWLLSRYRHLPEFLHFLFTFFLLWTRNDSNTALKTCQTLRKASQLTWNKRSFVITHFKVKHILFQGCIILSIQLPHQKMHLYVSYFDVHFMILTTKHAVKFPAFWDLTVWSESAM